MKLYHISDTLKLGDTLQPDYQKNIHLVEPFVQALEQSMDCFYGMVLNGKYLAAVLDKYGLYGWPNYAKWATEGAFEFIRKTEFPNSYCRMNCIYYCDNLSACQKYYDFDWGRLPKEDQEKVHLFEVEVHDRAPQRRDMRLYDKAYKAMSMSKDIPLILDYARKYFKGAHTINPLWEILSDKPATAVADRSEYLRK